MFNTPKNKKCTNHVSYFLVELSVIGKDKMKFFQEIIFGGWKYTLQQIIRNNQSCYSSISRKTSSHYFTTAPNCFKLLKADTTVATFSLHTKPISYSLESRDKLTANAFMSMSMLSLVFSLQKKGFFFWLKEIPGTIVYIISLRKQAQDTLVPHKFNVVLWPGPVTVLQRRFMWRAL